jgi:hypothetical protein
VILFFIDFPYLAFERGSEPDELGRLWRVVVDRIAPHQLSTRDEFEVVEVDVRLCALLPSLGEYGIGSVKFIGAVIIRAKLFSCKFCENSAILAWWVPGC